MVWLSFPVCLSTLSSSHCTLCHLSFLSPSSYHILISCCCCYHLLSISYSTLLQFCVLIFWCSIQINVRILMILFFYNVGTVYVIIIFRIFQIIHDKTHHTFLKTYMSILIYDFHILRQIKLMYFTTRLILMYTVLTTTTNSLYHIHTTLRIRLTTTVEMKTRGTWRKIGQSNTQAHPHSLPDTNTLTV